MMNKDEILRELSPPQEKERYRWDVYGKNQYCHRVKFDNWWYQREAYPKDYDAFHPPGDTRRSSYIRLGTDGDHWTTETGDQMKAGLGDSSLAELIKRSQRRSMLNFLSYPRTQKQRKGLLKEEIRAILPSLPKDLLKMRYTTTYNSNYKHVYIIPKK